MAMEGGWICSICRDWRMDVAYAIPCEHRFCLGCILRWAKRKPDCPLCREPMTAIRASVRGDNDFLECVISTPGLPAPVGFQEGITSNPLSPVQNYEELMSTVAPGGHLTPEAWASLFRLSQDLLNPVLPWLRQELSVMYMNQWWPIMIVESIIMYSLCQVGLSRDSLLRELEDDLEDNTVPLIDGLIDTIVRLCSEEAWRLLGLLDAYTAQEQEDRPAAVPDSPGPSSSLAGPNTEEQPSMSSAALQGVPSHPHTAAIPREQEEPQEELGQAAAAAPAAQGCSRSPFPPGQDRQGSPGGSRRPLGRRASSTPGSAQPCKR
ncbi:TOPRS ligase, partial [Alectura lathami]|nr:TOPRS ligase [Alectura lathami]